VHWKCKGISKGPPIDVMKEFLRVLELVEEDLGIQYMVEKVQNQGNFFKLYRIS
jgi:hypothetical protein